jgi:DNA-directed RNA polymerase specialized sigma24 family protein
VAEITYEWPESVPQDYEELLAMHGRFIAQQVQNHNKVHRNFEDLFQEVWMRLKANQVLENFVAGATFRLPAKMHVIDVCAYFGIKFSTWRQHQSLWMKYEKTIAADGVMDGNPPSLYMPSPIEGKRCSDEVFYNGADILLIQDTLTELEARGMKKRPFKPVRERIHPPITAHGFKAYLARAIHNIFANFCRTVDRKCKEQLMPPEVSMARHTDGTYHVRHVEHRSDSAPSWESSLTAAMEVDDEELVDMAATIRKAGVDVTTTAGRQIAETANALHRQNRPTDEKLRVLDLVCHGWSLREALDRVMKIDERLRLVVNG